jgi:putative tryptophan/tyrosine transport system substrate-binding protein
MGDELGAKRLELLRELLPSVRKIALLVNPNNPSIAESDILGAEQAARRLGLEIFLVNAATAKEIEAGFATAVQQRVNALTFGAEGFLNSRRDQIAALALRYRLPTMSAFRETAAAGILMSYGPSPQEQYRQAGVYVGRILKGERPADLPVMQPTRFELVVNLKTAKAMGLTIPETFLVRADEVIE